MLYQGIMTGRLNGEPWQSGLYFRNNNLNLEGIRNTWAASVNELLTIPVPGKQSYLNIMASTDYWSDAWAYQIDETTDRKIARTFSTPSIDFGSTPGQDIQERDCVLVLLYTATRTRRIGRMYLPRIPANNLNNGAIAAATQQNIKDCVTQMFTYMGTQQCTPVIRSREKHIDEPVGSWLVSNHLAARPSRRPAAPPSYL